VLALDWLDRCVELMFMFGVLVKLGENFPHIINKQLRKFLVRLEYEAEKLTVIIVNYI